MRRPVVLASAFAISIGFAQSTACSSSTPFVPPPGNDSGSGGGGGTGTTNAQPGTYVFTVTAVAGTVVHSTQVTVNVP